MPKKKAINNFLTQKEIAVVGVSRNKHKFGFLAYNLLKRNNYTVYPINPNIDNIEESPCYPDVNSLPNSVNAVFIITPKSQTVKIVHETISKGIKNIWIQKTAETPEAIDIAEKNQICLVKHECIFMYLDPRRMPHNIHRLIKKISGNLSE